MYLSKIYFFLNKLYQKFFKPKPNIDEHDLDITIITTEVYPPSDSSSYDEE